METIINTIPGYRLYEYLLVLSPHEELWNRIMKLKENFAAKHESDFARWGNPHITLASFLQYEIKEARIINHLERIAMGYRPFKVELKDFGYVPPHMIYINIESKLPVQNLVKEIRTGSTELMKLNDGTKPHFIMEPHITIGRKLKPAQFEKAWLEYSNSHFTGRFIANGMTLLKRPVDEMKYHIAAKFDFQNLPVATKQGELF